MIFEASTFIGKLTGAISNKSDGNCASHNLRQVVIANALGFNRTKFLNLDRLLKDSFAPEVH